MAYHVLSELSTQIKMWNLNPLHRSPAASLPHNLQIGRWRHHPEPCRKLDVCCHLPAESFRIYMSVFAGIVYTNQVDGHIFQDVGRWSLAVSLNTILTVTGGITQNHLESRWRHHSYVC